MTQMKMVLDKLTSPLVRNNPRIIKTLARILPFLTYAQDRTTSALLDFFSPAFDFDAFDTASTDPQVSAHQQQQQVSSNREKQS